MKSSISAEAAGSLAPAATRGAAGSRAASSPLQRVGSGILWVIAALSFIFLYAPVVVLIAFSFNDSESLALPIRGLTTRWYGEVFRDASLLEGLKNTLIVATATALLSGLLGTVGAFTLSRLRFRGRGLVMNLAIVPMTIPALLLGLSLLIFFHQSGIPRSLATIVIGHVTFTLPFVLVIVTSRLAGFDIRLEEAARDLGASQVKTFWEVTLPLIFPAVLAGALFAFTLSLDDFIVAFLLTGTESTLPLKIWTMLRFGLSLKVNALATMLLVASFVLVSASLFFMRDRSARRPS